MPEFSIPFALKSFDAYSDWISERNPALFPEALNLDTLDPEQAINLRTWLVAHVEIQPHKPSSLQPKKAVSSSKPTSKFSSQKVKPKEGKKAVQLSLFDSLF